jgi:pimeloyl-ACP methyl ester carboxylesterase
MKEEKITIKKSNGQRLVGIVYTNGIKVGNTNLLVIFCHGYRSTKENRKVRPLAQSLVSNKISLFAFDFSGRGESDGKFEDTTITQYLNDLKSVVDYFSKTDKQIGVIGSSLGGLVVLNEVVKDKIIKAMVLWSPESYFASRKKGDYSSESITQWKEKGHIFTHSQRFGQMRINYQFYEDGLRYQDYSTYEHIKIPALIIHGTKDESVSVTCSEELAKHIKNSRLVKLDGAEHDYPRKEDLDRVIIETTKFLKEALK